LPFTYSLSLGEKVSELLDDLGSHRLGTNLEILLLCEVHVLGNVGKQLGDEDIVD
jgi:hypothetical protein